MQNIPPFEQVFYTGKDKNIAGLPCSILQLQLPYNHSSSLYYISE